MYLEYWDLTDFPFENVANQRFYYESDDHKNLYEDLYDGIIRRKGAITLTGDIGCGKSTLSQRVLLSLPEEQFDIALITYSRLTPVEMLNEICHQLGLQTADQDRTRLLKTIQSHLTKNADTERSTVICIDEAQTIPSLATFEELRLLLNFQLGDRFLITLLLIGQPELQRKIAKLPQLQQRIALNLTLGHFDLRNTMRYILHRLHEAGCNRPILTRKAIDEIHRHTGGVPRRINHLVDRCLMVGKRLNVTNIDSLLVNETMQRYPC